MNAHHLSVRRTATFAASVCCVESGVGEASLLQPLHGLSGSHQPSAFVREAGCPAVWLSVCTHAMAPPWADGLPPRQGAGWSACQQVWLLQCLGPCRVGASCVFMRVGCGPRVCLMAAELWHGVNAACDSKPPPGCGALARWRCANRNMGKAGEETAAVCGHVHRP